MSDVRVVTCWTKKRPKSKASRVHDSEEIPPPPHDNCSTKTRTLCLLSWLCYHAPSTWRRRRRRSLSRIVYPQSFFWSLSTIVHALGAIRRSFSKAVHARSAIPNVEGDERGGGGGVLSEFIQNHTSVRRDANTLSRNASFKQSADEIHTRSPDACLQRILAAGYPLRKPLLPPLGLGVLAGGYKCMSTPDGWRLYKRWYLAAGQWLCRGCC